MSDQSSLPKRTPEELARDLRTRADLLTGASWERDATAAMMREAADLIATQEAERAALVQELQALSLSWQVRSDPYHPKCASELDQILSTSARKEHP
jgi:hypothetical protein